MIFPQIGRSPQFLAYDFSSRRFLQCGSAVKQVRPVHKERLHKLGMPEFRVLGISIEFPVARWTWEFHPLTARLPLSRSPSVPSFWRAVRGLGRGGDASTSIFFGCGYCSQARPMWTRAGRGEKNARAVCGLRFLEAFMGCHN